MNFFIVVFGLLIISFLFFYIGRKYEENLNNKIELQKLCRDINRLESRLKNKEDEE